MVLSGLPDFSVFSERENTIGVNSKDPAAHGVDLHKFHPLHTGDNNILSQTGSQNESMHSMCPEPCLVHIKMLNNCWGFQTLFLHYPSPCLACWVSTSYLHAYHLMFTEWVLAITSDITSRSQTGQRKDKQISGKEAGMLFASGNQTLPRNAPSLLLTSYWQNSDL